MTVWDRKSVSPWHRPRPIQPEPPPGDCVPMLVTVLLDPRLTPTDKHVYALVDYLPCPEQAELADLLSLGLSTIQRAFSRLERLGWVRIIRRAGQRANRCVPVKRPPMGAEGAIRQLRRLRAMREPPVESKLDDRRNMSWWSAFTSCRSQGQVDALPPQPGQDPQAPKDLGGYCRYLGLRKRSSESRSADSKPLEMKAMVEADGLTLKQFLYRHALSETELATLIGKTLGTITRLIRGKNTCRPATLRAVATALSQHCGREITTVQIVEMVERGAKAHENG